MRVITENVEMISGFAVCLAGSPTITVSGGKVRIFDDATPTIGVSGGRVIVPGNAKPVVRREDGTEIKPVVDMCGWRIYQ